MPSEDAAIAVAPYDDGCSTESECYDEDLLELAASASNEENDPISAPDSTIRVKVETTESVETDAVKVEIGAEKHKAKSTYKRCRHRLPVVSEKERNEIQQGKSNTKCCACCCEPFPMSKFGLANRDPTRAIPRCRSCSQAPPEILHSLRKSSQYAEAAAVEMKKVQAERQKKKATLPSFDRKTVKQRHEEQFQLVGARQHESVEWQSVRPRGNSDWLASDVREKRKSKSKSRANA